MPDDENLEQPHAHPHVPSEMVSTTLTGTPQRDFIKSTLLRKENHELAEDLLARFPGVDRAALLRDVVASAFWDMRRGDKREARAACDFLNEVQRIAERNQNGAVKP